MKLGRKQFSIWKHFERIVYKKGFRATCKKCKEEMHGIEKRLETHWSTCKDKFIPNQQPAIWEHFERKEYKKRFRATCKKCLREMKGTVHCLTTHWNVCRDETISNQQNLIEIESNLIV
jgi:hypothetical protein